jgi:hypothetical protein
MYSPKIAEDLVPVLYHLAKRKKMPMTRLVNTIIRNTLTKDLPDNAQCKTEPLSLCMTGEGCKTA